MFSTLSLAVYYIITSTGRASFTQLHTCRCVGVCNGIDCYCTRHSTPVQRTLCAYGASSLPYLLAP